MRRSFAKALGETLKGIDIGGDLMVVDIKGYCKSS